MKTVSFFLFVLICVQLRGEAACLSCGGAAGSNPANSHASAPYFSISLGAAQQGEWAGALTFGASQPSPSLFSPAGLQYNAPTRSDVTVVTTRVVVGSTSTNYDIALQSLTSPWYVTNNIGGTNVSIFTNTIYDSQVVSVTNISTTYVTNLVMRQVYAPQVLADIPPVPTSSGYVINFYWPANVGAADGYGVYAVSGTPFATWVVTNLNPADLGQAQVSDYTAADGLLKQWTCAYSPTNGVWSITDLGGIQKNMTTTNYGSGLFGIVNTLQYAGGQVVQQTTTIYSTNFSWGMAPVKVIMGGGSDLQTNLYTYFDPSPSGNMALKRSAIYADGSQQWFNSYDTNGNPLDVVSSYQDDPYGQETFYAYDPVKAGVSSTGDNGSVNPYTPRAVTNFVGGVEASCRYSIFPSAALRLDIQCTQPYPNDNWNNPNNLVTTNYFYTNGPNQFALQAVIRPDKTMVLYNYITNNNFQTNITVSGQPDPTYSYIVDGTSNVMVINQWGYPVANASWDVKSGLLLSKDVYGNYDIYGRPQQVAHLDGMVETKTYTCCGLQNQVDRDGLNTVYLYDSSRRQYGYQKLFDGTHPVTWQNTLDAVGRPLQSDRIGTDSSDITQSRFGYDQAGELVVETNALGGVTTHTRTTDTSSGGVIRTTVYPDGGTQVTKYYADGTLKSQTGTAVHGKAYSDGTATDANGNQCTYTQVASLDASGDQYETVQTFTDMAGRTTETLYADGSYSQAFYNAAGQLAKQIDPDGNVTLYQYDAKGQRTITAVAMNNLSETTPDFSHDHFTATTNFVTVDHGTNVWCSQNFAWVTGGTGSSLLSFSEAAVNGLNSWQTTFRDATVAVTNQTQTIPGISRVVTAIAADNTYSISDYQYGQLASVTRYDTNGVQVGATTYAYDPHERQSTVTDARNGATTYGYNNADEVNTVTTPAPGNGQSAETTTTLYDNRLRPYSVIQPDGTTVTTEYLPTGEKALEFGSRTYPVAYGYDYAGRLAAMTNWSNYSSLSGARVTTWTYDANRGWLNSKAYDDGHGPAYTYTAAGRLAGRTWARGVTTSYAYDRAGSLTNISYSDSTPGVTNSYDRLGRLTAVACNGLTDTLTYNLANELLGESFTGGPVAGLAVTNGYDQYLRRTNLTALAASLLSRTIYGYDADARLATVNDGNNDTATYSYLANSALVQQIVYATNGVTRMTTTKQYDFLNRLAQISSQGGTGVSPVAYNYNYNAANQRTQDRLADGSYWNYQYDALGQVTAGRKFWADGTVVAGQQFGYAFDTIGNRMQTQTGGDQNGRNLRVANYTANNLNQITSRDVPGYVEVQGVSFATNQVAVNGNTNSYRKVEYFRQEVGVANGSAAVWTNLTVTATNQASTTGNVYVAQAPENFTYDLDGNLINDGRWTYTWDAENRLINLTNNTGVGPLYNLAFAYDSKGRRIQKIETTNGVAFATNTFLYDGWNLVAELGTNNTLLRNYTWGNDLSGSAQGAGGVGGLLEATYHGASATTNAFVAYDGNGNVGALVNAGDGTLLANYEYGPFGEAIRATGPMAKVNPFRFSTKYQDDESDLLYYGHRYYKPSTGTWMSRDPLGDLYFLLEQIWATKALQLREHLREGANLPSYLFVKGDPISQIDIIGLSWGYDSNPNYTWAMPNKYNCGAGTLDGYIQVWLGGGKKNIKGVDDGSLTGGSDKSSCPPLYSTGFSFGDTPGGFIIGTGIETGAGSVAGEKVEVCHVCLATCCAGSIKNSRTTIPLNGYKIVKIGPCASYTLTDIPGEYDLGSYGTVSDSPSSDFNQMVNGKSPSALGGGCFACQH